MDKLNIWLAYIRKEMKSYDIDILFISTKNQSILKILPFSDSFPEIISHIFKFDGSNCVVIISYNSCFILTDSRYIESCKNLYITEKIQYIENIPEPDLVIEKFYLIDSRIISLNLLLKQLSEDIIQSKNINLSSNCNSEDIDNARIWYDSYNIPNSVWRNIEKILQKKAKILPIPDLIYDTTIKKSQSQIHNIIQINDAGETQEQKIYKVKSLLNKNESILISDPASISWLLNLRDINNLYDMTINGVILLNNNEVVLFCDLDISPSLLCKAITMYKLRELQNHVTLISQIESKDNENFSLRIDIHSMPQSVFELIKVLNIKLNPSECYISDLKSIKSENEIKNIAKVHYLDSLSFKKFLNFIKSNIFKGNTEHLESFLANKLFELKLEEPNFINLSFDTISAINDHAAQPHYKTRKFQDIKNIEIIAQNSHNNSNTNFLLYLIDAGGQYKYGTTDITRVTLIKTTNIGLNEEEINEVKKYYTAVLKAHISLASTIFPQNTPGNLLDSIARKHLWQYGLDYGHGTGHGVGYLSCVHEGGYNFSSEKPLKSNIILSIEPGVYISGKYGIRIENLYYTKRVSDMANNEYPEKLLINGFNNADTSNQLFFAVLTKVPMEEDLILYDTLDKNEKEWLLWYKNLL